MFVLKALLLVSVLVMSVSCAQVGSKRWCQDMKGTPKGEWTFKETKEYTAHCFFKKKDSAE